MSLPVWSSPTLDVPVLYVRVVCQGDHEWCVGLEYPARSVGWVVARVLPDVVRSPPSEQGPNLVWQLELDHQDEHVDHGAAHRQLASQTEARREEQSAGALP